MSIPVTTPSAVNFPGPYIGNACRVGTGDGTVGREIAFSIPWNTQGGPNNCVNIDLRQNNVPPIQELRTLYVDNLSNSHATVIVMNDTNYRFVAPAFTCEFYPVITNGLQFTVYNVGEIFGDTTNIIALNIEVDGPPQINENIPDVAYQYIVGEGIFPVVQSNDMQPNAINLNTTQTNIFSFSAPDLYFMTGFDVFLNRSSNATGSAIEVSMSIVVTYTQQGGGTVSFIQWVGGVYTPANSTVSNLLLAHFEDLQVLLDASNVPNITHVEVDFNIANGASVSGFVFVNATFGQVPK